MEIFRLAAKACAVQDNHRVPRLPPDGERPTTENTFRLPWTAELLEQFRSGNSLLDLVPQLEALTTPGTGKLLAEDAQPIALELLSGIEPDRLEAMLSRLYTFRRLHELSWDKDSDRFARFSRENDPGDVPSAICKEFDVGIYVNDLVPRSGVPLTVDEFDGFLRAMLHLSHANEHNTALWARELREFSLKRPAGHEDGGCDLTTAVKKFWLYYTDRDGTHFSHRDITALYLGGSASAATEAREAMRQFCRYHMAYLKTIDRSKIVFVPMPPYIGYSNRMEKRCLDHRKLEWANEPVLFQLAFCLLNVLFPEKQFKMFQWVVFRCAKESEASIGETLASHLWSSYSTVGGFNAVSGGVQVSSVREQTDQDWAETGLFLQEQGVLDRRETTLRVLREQKAKEMGEEADQACSAAIDGLAAKVKKVREHVDVLHGEKIAADIAVQTTTGLARIRAALGLEPDG